MPAPENLIIDTPEQITLEFPLAGVGSRFLAIAFDTLVQAVAVLVLVLIALAARMVPVLGRAGGGPWVLAVITLAWFVIYMGYFACFEAIWTGQTPGKRVVGLRVIDASGGPVSVYSTIIRNLLRIVDQLPGIYAVGILSVLITRRQQRLGDLAAGTVVVHERSEAMAPARVAAHAGVRLGAHKLGAEDIVLIESFLRRRDDLDSWLRRQTAHRIAARMAGKLGIEGANHDEEPLLERLAAEYRSTDRYR